MPIISEYSNPDNYWDRKSELNFCLTTNDQRPRTKDQRPRTSYQLRATSYELPVTSYQINLSTYVVNSNRKTKFVS